MVLAALAIRLMVNTAALLLAAMMIKSLAPDAVHIADWPSAILAALLYGLVNALIRPFVSLITLPLQLLTLGLFTLVINGAMLLLTSNIARAAGIGFWVSDFWAALGTALLISIVSTVLTRLAR